MSNPINPPQHTINQSQLEHAKIYGTRYDFIKTLPKGISFLEIGTLAGDFALKVIEACSPEKVALVDPFNVEDFFWPEYGYKRWEHPSENYDFVKNRFKDMNFVKIYRGLGIEVMPEIKEKYDFIYIDADNTSMELQTHFREARMHLKENGVIGFNDYNMYDNADSSKSQDVVPFINGFLKFRPSWRVHAFALNDNLTSDIYLTATDVNNVFAQPQ